jgi:hypothetical protein
VRGNNEITPNVGVDMWHWLHLKQGALNLRQVKGTRIGT